ncbi:protein ripply2 [Hyperolius riggenbachi]|uniref:protein ripply2 n=1 Tax=Hyperolius riggenbachi TaxID=752182 RepID=UPI0035A2CD8D
MWRPWHNTAVTSMAAQHLPITLQQCPCGSDLVTSSDQVKLPSFQHPVKLFWPKSKYYDFLYQDAEELLKNFPVQATIVLYEESDSSSGSEDEESTDN